MTEESFNEEKKEFRKALVIEIGRCSTGRREGKSEVTNGFDEGLKMNSFKEAKNGS